MCRQIYDWNIVACDVKPPISPTLTHFKICCLNMGKTIQVFGNVIFTIWFQSAIKRGRLDPELNKTCSWNTDAIVQIWKVLHFDPLPTQEYVMSVNYEQPFDKITVQVWLFYDHPNFKHVQVGRNYGQTDKRTDGRSIKEMFPAYLFRPGV